MTVPGEKIEAVLIDVGGVILDEDILYDILLGAVHNGLAQNGIDVPDGHFKEGVLTVMQMYVPSLQRALVWHYTKPDVTRYRAVCAYVQSEFGKWAEEQPRHLVPGIREALDVVRQKYPLLLAANAPASVREHLQHCGILHLFSSTDVSADIQLDKPDPRFFLHLLSRSGHDPSKTVMVGDRIDNDIIPAKRLGMKAVWFRSGLYKVLGPRTPEEMPDAVVEHASALPKAIEGIGGMILPSRDEGTLNV
jgi:HAD superfamily hydrolase (TIGR01509 family)